MRSSWPFACLTSTLSCSLLGLCCFWPQSLHTHTGSLLDSVQICNHGAVDRRGRCGNPGHIRRHKMNGHSVRGVFWNGNAIRPMLCPAPTSLQFVASTLQACCSSLKAHFKSPRSFLNGDQANAAWHNAVEDQHQPELAATRQHKCAGLRQHPQPWHGSQIKLASAFPWEHSLVTCF